MRTRSTWTKPEGSETPRQAATQRHADIYTMNQDHPQPAATDYESGDPDSWAETPTTNKNVEQEYEGDHVKRNELGFGEFRDDTWKHKDVDKWNDGKKYDNKTAAERKASAVERVARAILRTSDDNLVREAAIDLMGLPDQVVVATLKRMEKVSPDALPTVAKHRRAFACTKLAARLLGDVATEQSVERLATTFMTVDDPTLRSILQTVASAQAAANKRVAQEEEQEEEGKTSQQTVQAQEQEEEQEEGKTSQQTVQAQEEEQEEEGKTSQEQEQEQQEEGHTSEEQQEAHGLSPQEMGMLDQMLHSEMGECAPGAGAPAGDADLMSIFTPPAAAAPMPAVPMPAPAMASVQDGMPEVSFDDDDDDAGAVNLASVADLFSDDPEVQAQRQIRAAHHEQVQRVAQGYQGIGRTASAGGAKKVGKVQPAKPTPAQQLESLWDRP